MSELVLEAGKTYVFKDEEAKEDYIGFSSDINRWELELIWERKELTEQQKKILELEEKINKAQEQIKQLKGEHNV